MIEENLIILQKTYCNKVFFANRAFKCLSKLCSFNDCRTQTRAERNSEYYILIFTYDFKLIFIIKKLYFDLLHQTRIQYIVIKLQSSEPFKILKVVVMSIVQGYKIMMKNSLIQLCIQ